MVGLAVLRGRRRAGHGVLHAHRPPAERGADRGRAGIWLADGRFVLAFGREADGDDDLLRPGELRVRAPFELWRLRVDGVGRAFARAEDVALARDPSRRSSWAGSCASARGPSRSRSPPGLTDGVASRHYEQPGSISGVLEVGGAARAASPGAGMRDHSWGVRDWQGVPTGAGSGCSSTPTTSCSSTTSARPTAGRPPAAA